MQASDRTRSRNNNDYRAKQCTDRSFIRLILLKTTDKWDMLAFLAEFIFNDINNKPKIEDNYLS